MNNTRTLAIVAVLTAATLVVGVTFAAATATATVQNSTESLSENGFAVNKD